MTILNLHLCPGAAAIGLLLCQPPALAVDGCQVLLCFAAPQWRAIAQCVPPIEQVLHDLARGKPFPTCNLASSGSASNQASQATHQWARAPQYCPPQYTRRIERRNGPVYECDYIGAVAVTVDGSVWSRTWWNLSGATVTEFSPAAKATMGTWDTHYDDDHAAWLATAPAASCEGC